ncbi:hypothetical protein TRVL_04869 [Trypanosoma vivax]|nr:hypothetical protein TRVL_04869 [Trypanosoma vivax]
MPPRNPLSVATRKRHGASSLILFLFCFYDVAVWCHFSAFFCHVGAETAFVCALLVVQSRTIEGNVGFIFVISRALQRCLIAGSCSVGSRPHVSDTTYAKRKKYT